MQILVLGMHRSGTSLVTRLLNLMGAYAGSEKSAIEHLLGGVDPHNAKGHWEHIETLRLNDSMLELNKAKWWQAGELFRTHKDLPEALVNRMQLFLLDMDAHRPWVLKDPRFCLTLPYWKPYLEVPVAILVYRDPAEVAMSMHLRDGLPLEYSLALWEFYTVSLLNSVQDIPHLFVQHADFINSPKATTAQLYQALTAGKLVAGLRLPLEREVDAFIDPQLSHVNRQPALKFPTLSENQQHLAAILSRKIPWQGYLSVSHHSQELLSDSIGIKPITQIKK